MKSKHFLVFAVVFALVALGTTSCSKPSEKRIIGKWQIISEQHRDSYNPEWVFDEWGPVNVIVYEFVKDGISNVYYNETLDYTSTWSYDKSADKILYDGNYYDVIECTSSEMVWHYKDIREDEWIEGQINFKKVK
jgi:hypothetical protein